MVKVIAVACFLSLAQEISYGQQIKLERVYKTDPMNHETSFYRVRDLATSADGFAYVADVSSFTITKLDSEGHIAAVAGSRGEGPAEFAGGPGRIAVLDDEVMVFDTFPNRRVVVFDLDLNPQRIFHIDFPEDVTASRHSFLYISGYNPSDLFSANLLRTYTKEGNLLEEFEISELSYYSMENRFSVFEDGEGNLVLVYQFINRVDVLDAGGNLVSRHSIADLPERIKGDYKLSYPKKASKEMIEISKRNSYFPGGAIFPGAAIDNKGHVFLEHQNGTKHTVYVLNYHSGKVISTLELPSVDTPMIMHIDQAGYLYTRENMRSAVAKYKIHYF